MNSEDKDEYKVGYKKPPKSGQFPKGTSGNTKGRPKGAKNTDNIIAEMMDKKQLSKCLEQIGA